MGKRVQINLYVPRFLLHFRSARSVASISKDVSHASRSGTSQEHEVVSEDQVIKAAAAPEPPEKRPPAPPAEPFEEAFEAAQGAVPCYPVASSTAKIFAPRTADMNKGFLMFADDDSGLTGECGVAPATL